MVEELVEPPDGRLPSLLSRQPYGNCAILTATCDIMIS